MENGKEFGMNKRKLLLMIAGTSTLIAVIMFIMYGQWKELQTNEAEQQVAAEETKEAVEEEVEVTPERTTITIGMVGDILLHQPMYYYGNFDFAFEAVKDVMEDVDFLLANQESMPGGEALGLSNYPIFNSPKSIIGGLQNNGVDFVTIANNHTLDKGEAQVLHSIQTLKEYDMPYTGAFESYEDMERLRIVDIDGVQVGVLAYTYGTNTYKKEHPDGKEYLVNIIDEARIIEDIQKMKKKQADVIVLAMHWGTEYSNDETEEQRQMAKNLFDAGADIIFGHHPHVLQPSEMIDGKPVFYSIGNYYSGMPWAGTNIGGIARVTVTKETRGEESSISIDESNFFPTAVVKDAVIPNFNPAFRVVPLESIGSQLGYTPEWVENLLGVPSWSLEEKATDK